MFSKGNQPKDLESRRAILWMSPSAVIPMMTGRRWVVVEGNLPQDAQYRDVFWDPSRQVWGLVVISKEFKALKVAEKMPELPAVTFRMWEEKDGEIK